MNALIIYDSYFGNTKKIAEAVARGLGSDTKLVSVLEMRLNQLDGVELLILGSPIRGWQPTDNMKNFIANFKKGQLNNFLITTFDTRVRLFFHGDAAKPMADKLVSFGASLIVPTNSFDVEGKEGPLFSGEEEKAVTWGELISSEFRKLKSNKNTVI